MQRMPMKSHHPDSPQIQARCHLPPRPLPEMHFVVKGARKEDRQFWLSQKNAGDHSWSNEQLDFMLKRGRLDFFRMLDRFYKIVETILWCSLELEWDSQRMKTTMILLVHIRRASASLVSSSPIDPVLNVFNAIWITNCINAVNNNYFHVRLTV